MTLHLSHWRAVSYISRRRDTTMVRLSSSLDSRGFRRNRYNKSLDLPLLPADRSDFDVHGALEDEKVKTEQQSCVLYK